MFTKTLIEAIVGASDVDSSFLMAKVELRTRNYLLH